MQHFEPFTLDGVRCLGERVLCRAEHEGEWRAKLVAHVGEERRLRTIQLCKGFGPSALSRICCRIRDCRRGLTCDKLEESAVRVSERPTWTDARDEKRRGSFLAGRAQRHDDRLIRRFAPGSGLVDPRSEFNVCDVNRPSRATDSASGQDKARFLPVNSIISGLASYPSAAGSPRRAMPSCRPEPPRTGVRTGHQPYFRRA